MKNQNVTGFRGWHSASATFVFFLILSANAAQAKDIIGSLEHVKINNTDLTFDSKIDTGAKTSSLNTTNIREIYRDETTWIQFDVISHEGKMATIEKPLKRFVKIKKKGSGTQRRPVILLDICLGTVLKMVEVNLVDRSNFNYQMLIGRSFLSGSFIVDVDMSYTHEPRCKIQPS